jgi:nucleoside-diphosphate-sugar epimerase
LKTISILGSGWLGLPLARHFIAAGFLVKASTTSENRIADLKSIGAVPFVVNIESLTNNLRDFLQADILIVNITSKDIASFRRLADEIEDSEIENVIFVSSTSVYQNIRKTITESDTKCFSQSPLLDIEQLLECCKGVSTTIVRFGGLIGYRRHPGRFFSQGRVVQNPDSAVNLIHRDDCIGIISQIVEQQVWGEVVNCCADTHPTKREFYTRAAESLGGSLPTFGESDSESGKLISNQKVKRLLNYEFKHPDLMKIEFEEST